MFQKSRIIDWYGYRYAKIQDVFLTFKYSTVGYDDGFFNKKLNDNLEYYTWFKDSINIFKKKFKYKYLDTNKVVAKFLTESGNIFYVDWRDGMLSFGLGVKCI